MLIYYLFIDFHCSLLLNVAIIFQYYHNSIRFPAIYYYYIYTMWGTIASILAGFVLVAAWIAGYLDPYQRKLQEYVLGKMGETKVSYGIKSNLLFASF